MLEIINQAAKLEFEFLINGLKCDLIGVDTEEIIQLIDKKTKELKVMVSFKDFLVFLIYLLSIDVCLV